MPTPTAARPWLNWYDTARWQKKARMQMRMHPLCVMCSAKGIVTAARVADHIIPHKGDYHLFWFGRLQSLCSECHSSSKAQIENKGYTNDIGTDGFPLDDNHPFNKASSRLKRWG